MLNKNFPTHRRFPLPNVSTFLTHTYMNITNPWPWGACECLDNVNVSTLKLSPSFLTTGLLQLKPKLQTPIFTALKLGLKLLLSIPNVLAPGFHNFNCATKLHPKQNHTHTHKRERGSLVHWYIVSRCGGMLSFCRRTARQFDFSQNMAPPWEYEWFVRYEDNIGMHQKKTFKVHIPRTNTEPKTNTRYVP